MGVPQNYDHAAIWRMKDWSTQTPGRSQCLVLDPHDEEVLRAFRQINGSSGPHRSPLGQVFGAFVESRASLTRLFGPPGPHSLIKEIISQAATKRFRVLDWRLVTHD
jgi:hypothetical protein